MLLICEFGKMFELVQGEVPPGWEDNASADASMH